MLACRGGGSRLRRLQRPPAWRLYRADFGWSGRSSGFLIWQVRLEGGTTSAEGIFDNDSAPFTTLVLQVRSRRSSDPTHRVAPELA